MRLFITFILLVLFCDLLNAQQSLDTIYANEKKNVALFFPKPIRQGIVGASHFVFTYNREKGQYFGLLQAKPGIESNLLTVTNDGNVYAYILKYSDKLSKLNYFIGTGERIGNEKPITNNIKPIVSEVGNYANRITFFEKFSKYLLKLKPENLATKRNNGLKLQLQKMLYQGSEVYLVIEFTNNSGINFEIDYLNVYRVNGNNKRKASYQKLEQQVIHKYKFISIVKDKQSKRFVLVIPKFVLGSNEKLELELVEKSGNRPILLKAKS